MIPSHLASLPTWRGLPVPYINARGAELDEHAWERRYDELVGAEAWFTAPALTDAEPDFTKQCLQRERVCAVLGRCQVCRRVLRASPRWLVASAQTSIQLVNIDGVPGQHPAFVEPWLCHRCLSYATTVCPGLIRRRRDDDLAVMRADRWTLLRTQTWHDDHGPDVVACSWVKIVVTAGAWIEVDAVPDLASQS